MGRKHASKVEWLQEIMCGNWKIDDSTYPDANVAAAQILVEIHYRYVSTKTVTIPFLFPDLHEC
jgi:hypothetical protein